MTFPSAGCQTCKVRRIKCDETKPICQRCIKSKRVCYGMQSSRLICSKFHTENCYASGQKKRPRGPRSMRRTRIIPHYPINDVQAQAMAYYFTLHLERPQEISTLSRSVADDFLPIWKIAEPNTPMLDLAVSCMALAIFSRAQHYPVAAIEAALKYQKLLQITQATIPVLDQGNVEACLLATFFMARYEQVSIRSGKLKHSYLMNLQSFMHHDGALVILKIWKAGHLGHVQLKSDVVKHTRRAMFRSAILRNLSLPEWIQDGASFGEKGLELEYDHIIIRIINLRYQLIGLSRKKCTAELTSLAAKFHQEVIDIDKALQEWNSHFSEAWIYRRHTLSTSLVPPITDFLSETIFTYANLAHAALWNQYFATQILIISTQLRIIKVLNCATYDEEEKSCRLKMKNLADDLASSVPFSLQRFKFSGFSNSEIILTTKDEIKPYVANLVIWPLSLASSLEHIDLQQKNWFCTVLARLGNIIGDRVIESADADEWLEL